MTIGEMDGIRKGDLVGAITGESGITADRIGKVELRENHSLVEIAADDVDRVIEAMNGKTLRNRRVVVRADQERSEREDRAGGASPGESGTTADRIDKVETGDTPPLVHIAAEDVARVTEAMRGKTRRTRGVGLPAAQGRSGRGAPAGGAPPPRREFGGRDDRPR